MNYFRQLRNKVHHYYNKIYSVLRTKGIHGLWQAISRKLIMKRSKASYLSWVRKYGSLSLSDRANIKAQLQNFAYKPLISIIMPTYNSPVAYLKSAIESVLNQLYENWELCIADDASTSPEVTKLLEHYAQLDPRIKVVFRSENGHISVASNTALAMASGEFVGFLDHDDELTEHALYHIVNRLNQDKTIDVLYSDEDHINERNVHCNPFFKPDWSPELLLTQNYICHFLVVRRSLVEQVNGFRVGFEGAQDYDLILRLAELTDKIAHISKILYGWRESPSSTAHNPQAKPYAQKAGQRAIQEYVDRMYGKGNVVVNEDENNLFIYDTRFNLQDKPLLSIIIPTKDGLSFLKPCIESIISKTTYEPYEILILDNNSEQLETRQWFAKIQAQYNNVRVIPAYYPFNWSKLNNHGIREAKGNFLVFLNNDTKVIAPDWLDRIVEHLVQEHIGVVGAQLCYEDGTIQHAGVVVGIGGYADHIYRGKLAIHQSTPFVSPLVKRNVLAVTGACLAIAKKTLDRIGHFNEEFIVCGSDVEICIRSHEHGFSNIYDPYVKLFHLESKTRDPKNIPAVDFILSDKAYKPYIENGDPFYNENLSLIHTTPTWKN